MERERANRMLRQQALQRIIEATEEEEAARRAEEEADAAARALREEHARFGRTASEQAELEGERFDAAMEALHVRPRSSAVRRQRNRVWGVG